MRFRLFALVGLFSISHIYAADQLIKLPKQSELQQATSGNASGAAKDAPVKEVAQAPAQSAAQPAGAAKDASAAGDASSKPAASAPVASAPVGATTAPAAAAASASAPAPVTTSSVPNPTATVKDAASLKQQLSAHEAALAKEKPDVAVEPSPKPQTKAEVKEEDDMQKLAERITLKLGELRANRDKKPKVAARKKNAHITKVSHAPAAAPVKHANHSHWSYEGEGGPSNWHSMNASWAKCGTGTRQSPIDIRDGLRVDLDPLQFDYKPSGFNVVDNGHTIQVNPGVGNTFTLTGRNYELIQFHFHRPSEERVNGKSFPMVVHLVHKDQDGKLAVVALLIEEGNSNNVIQQVWNNMPLEKNDPVMATSLLDLPKLLPARRDYYTYMGSLTTPPCNEGVLWIVFKEPVQVSSQQVGIFSRFYPMNARPIQSVAGRIIKESN